LKRLLLALALLLSIATLYRARASGVSVGPPPAGVDAAGLERRLLAEGRPLLHDGVAKLIRLDRAVRHADSIRRNLAWLRATRVASTAAFAALLARHPFLDHFAVRDRRIALTLDDGPSPLTPRALAILARRHVRATFFLVGSHAARFPRYLTMIRDEGHEIENHTWSHELGLPYTPIQFTTSPLPHQIEEIRRTDRGLREKTRFMRAPGGLFGRCRETVEAARVTGKVIVNWDVAGDTPGWQHVANHKIVGMTSTDLLRDYEAQVRSGSIILMHPENPTDAPYTLSILDRFIVDMQRKGYRFVTLNELLR
jgi:peptidoglycan/xylan/chitin deacetylase (PgdA/CDA1 family)